MQQPSLTDAQVIAVHRDQCTLRFPDGERAGTITGHFRSEAPTSAGFPVVGDWASAEITGPRSALIHSLRPRRTALSRKAAGSSVEEQVLAANVDVAFIVSAFSEDFNPRRLERYLAVARQDGITTVLLLNKSDLAPPNDPRTEEATRIAGGSAVLRASALTGDGMDAVADLLKDGKIGIFLGSSGVGKSSMVNALLSGPVQATQKIRAGDGRGRHTTTARQLFPLPNGGCVIDTPGLREIQLWSDESALKNVYEDVAALAAACQFGNCRHETEPSCAVKAALTAGTLPAERWAGYQKLQEEIARLKTKTSPQQQTNKEWKKVNRDMREYVKKKQERTED